MITTILCHANTSGLVLTIDQAITPPVATYLEEGIAHATNNNYDFINCGSVIQYVKDYKSLLLNLINVSNKYIFFSATHFFDSSKKNEDNLIVKQVNLLPKVFFLYFFNKRFFYKLLFDNKYKIVFEKKNLTDNLNYKNFDEFVENTQYTDVLFKK